MKPSMMLSGRSLKGTVSRDGFWVLMGPWLFRSKTEKWIRIIFEFLEAFLIYVEIDVLLSVGANSS